MATVDRALGILRLSTYRMGRYVVGPAVIELDRQTRLRDPLILAAAAAMDALGDAAAAVGDVVLLCRLYKATVMCVDQRVPKASGVAVSYERGRPMPLGRGAASKAILANLPPRALRRYFDGADAGVDWAEFRRPFAAIRKAGVCITRGELDPGRIGVSAPVFVDAGEVVGSIGLVLSGSAPDSPVPAIVTEQVIEAGRRTTAALRGRA